MFNVSLHPQMNRLRALLTAALLALAVMLTTAPARAASLVVTSTNDNDDGTCNAAHCSLREAINASNASSGPDTITFNVGQAVITPKSQLPSLTDGETIIDGGQLIELNGADAISYGLVVISDYNRISGMTFADFAKHGVFIGDGTYSAAAKFNIIGTDSDGGKDVTEGNQFYGNGSSAIVLYGTGVSDNVVAGNIIGGVADGGKGTPNLTGIEITFGAHHNLIGSDMDDVADAVEGNVISDNQVHGLYITADAEFNTIAGNLIGTDDTGTQGFGNGNMGILLYRADNNIIGPGNTISSNGFAGIEVWAASYTTIIGNNIGTDITGNDPLGNLYFGIRINGGGDHGARGNLIGVRASGDGPIPAPNIIAYNGWYGVTVEKASGKERVNENPILYNSIFANGDIGIELTPSNFPCWDGVTANDPGDEDEGGNDVVNYPELISAEANATNSFSNAQIVDGLPNTEFIIQFYASPACDPSGNGEGRFYLGETTVTTDAAGNATTGNITLLPVPVGYFMNATATINGKTVPLSTSEFSLCMEVTQAPTLQINIQLILKLLAYLTNLIDNREIDAEIGQMLIAPASDALQALEREDTRTAAAEMEEFIALVAELVRAGKLTEEQGRILNTDASEILRLIQEGQ